MTCFQPLRLASRGPGEVLSYLLDKFWERLSNGAVTGPPHNPKKQTIKNYFSSNTVLINNKSVRVEINVTLGYYIMPSFSELLG